MHFSLFYTILKAAGLFPCRILRCFEVLPWLNSSPALPSRPPRWAAAGFYDYLDQGAVVAAEWSENFASLLAQEDPIRVDIQILDQTSRKITIEGVQL